jgi:hypothetical protein
MTRRFFLLLTLGGSVFTAGCGLLPTDRPPTDNPYASTWFPDRTQPEWHRLLFGTRWIPEGPAR